MDGPLGPDYQSRDVLLDLTPYIEAEGYDLGQLDDNAVKDFTTKDGVVVRPAARPQRDRALLQQGHVRRGRHPVPGRHLDWEKLVEVGKQLTKDTDGDGTIDQWGLYTETTDMENAWSSFVWQAGGDILTEDGTKSALDTARVRRRDPVPPGPDLEGEGGPGPGDLRGDRRCLRAGRGGDGDQRLLARPDPRGGRASTSASRRSRPDRPARRPRSTRRARSCTPTPRPRRRPGCSPSTSPAPRPRRRSWPSRPRCR